MYRVFSVVAKRCPKKAGSQGFAGRRLTYFVHTCVGPPLARSRPAAETKRPSTGGRRVRENESFGTKAVRHELENERKWDSSRPPAAARIDAAQLHSVSTDARNDRRCRGPRTATSRHQIDYTGGRGFPGSQCRKGQSADPDYPQISRRLRRLDAAAGVSVAINEITKRNQRVSLLRHGQSRLSRPVNQNDDTPLAAAGRIE